MYYKNVHYLNYNECFGFLKNHSTYDTMNSWNGLKSIANNVKLYNLPGIDLNEALEALEEDTYQTINSEIEEWQSVHPGYFVYFNGRSGGYLVLTSEYHHGHVFKDEPLSPVFFNSYDEWKKEVEEECGSLEEYRNKLISQVKLVQEFDQLCDDLIEVVKELIAQMKDRKARTKSYSAVLRFQRYYYDTLEDLKLHMLDMKEKGYSVYEYSEEDLYAEYEMNESINSEVVLEEGEEL